MSPPVFCEPSRDLPIVSVIVAFRSGSVLDPPAPPSAATPRSPSDTATTSIAAARIPAALDPSTTARVIRVTPATATAAPLDDAEASALAEADVWFRARRRSVPFARTELRAPSLTTDLLVSATSADAASAVELPSKTAVAVALAEESDSISTSPEDSIRDPVTVTEAEECPRTAA